MQLKWTDLAAINLDKIEDHIAKENSPLIAIDVVMSIVDGVPFIVIYRENMSTNTVEILRVLHDAQQWPTAN